MPLSRHSEGLFRELNFDMCEGPAAAGQDLIILQIHQGILDHFNLTIEEPDLATATVATTAVIGCRNILHLQSVQQRELILIVKGMVVVDLDAWYTCHRLTP